MGILSSLLGASVALAGNRGVAVHDKSKITAAIDFPGNVDPYLIDVPQGGTLTVSVKAAAGGTLLPGLALYFPDGTLADVSFAVKESGSKASMKLPFPTTGRFSVRVGARDGIGTGAYTVSFKIKSPKKSAEKDVSLPQGGIHRFPFPGADGVLVSARVDWDGPAPASVDMRDPADAVAVPASSFVPGADRASISGVLLAGGAGDYALRLQGSATGGAATVACSVKLKFPKGIKEDRVLDPQPILASVAPAAGPPGQAVTLTGSGFRAGGAVFFGDSAAGAVVVESATLITCTAPSGPESETGAVVDVTVQNTDGQFSVAAGGFDFTEPPVPLSAAPSTAPSYGGTEVTVTGTGITSLTKVFLDGTEVGGATLFPPTSLKFPMPEGSSGFLALRLENEHGQGSTRGDLLARTRSFKDRTATALPAAPEELTEFSATGTALGDLDGDGLLDLVLTVTPDSNEEAYGSDYGRLVAPTRVLTGGAGPAFALVAEGMPPPRTFEYYGYDYRLDGWAADRVGLGDLDGDGDLDMVLTSEPATYAYSYYYGYGYESYYDPAGGEVRTRLLLNDGSGAFSFHGTGMPAPLTYYYEGTDYVRDDFSGPALAMGDLDGDGDLDIVLGAPQPYVGYGSYYPLTRVLTNGGAADFSYLPGGLPPPVLLEDGYGYTTILDDFRAASVALGDLDGDGDLDLVMTHSEDTYGSTYAAEEGITRTRVLVNDGTAHFSTLAGGMPPPITFENYGYTYVRDDFFGDSVALGDLDGDGDADMVLGRVFGGNYDYSSRYYYDDASGSYKLTPAILLLRNDGTGTFTEATGEFLPDALFRTGSMSTILGVKGIQLGDLDGDGNLDMVVTGTDTYVYDYYGTGFGYYQVLPEGERPGTRVLQNQGSGSFIDATAAWFQPGGDLLPGDTVTLGDLDNDGDLDMVVGHDPAYYGYGGYGYGGYGESSARPVRIFEND